MSNIFDLIICCPSCRSSSLYKRSGYNVYPQNDSNRQLISLAILSQTADTFWRFHKSTRQIRACGPITFCRARIPLFIFFRTLFAYFSGVVSCVLMSFRPDKYKKNRPGLSSVGANACKLWSVDGVFIVRVTTSRLSFIL